MALFLSAGDFMNWDYWMKTSGSEVVKLLQLVSWSPDVSAIIVNTLLSAEKVCITSSYSFFCGKIKDSILYSIMAMCFQSIRCRP